MPNDQPDYVSPTAQVQRILGSVTAAAGLSANASFNIPTECQAIGLVIDGNAPNLTPASMSVTGNQSNQQLMGFPSVNPALHLEQRSIVDTSVTLGVTAPAGGPSKVTLLSYTSHPVVAVENLPDKPLTVAVQLSPVFLRTGAGIDITTALAGGSRTRLDVYESDPEPWQAPASSFVTGSGGASVAANGSVVLIAGVPAQTITLNRIRRFCNASNTVNVWESDDGAKAVWEDVHVSLGIDGIECGGITLPVGTGLRFRNINATATATFFPTVHYTQK